MFKKFAKVVGIATGLLIAAFLVMGQIPFPSTRPIIEYFSFLGIYQHQDDFGITFHGYDDLADSTADIGINEDGDFEIDTYNGGIRFEGDVRRIVFGDDAERTGEGTIMFANGVAIGMASPGDCQGMKLEFDYGVTKTSFAAGRMAIGVLVKMTMDEVYIPAATPYNAVVRGLSCQSVSYDSVGGRVTGAYINAIAKGTSELQGYWSGATSAGLVGAHIRTEVSYEPDSSDATIVTPAVAGIFIYHRSRASTSLSGDYRAIQINQPQIDAPGTMDGEEYGIYFCDDLGTADVFDYAFGFDTNLDGSGAAQICYAEVDMDGDMDSADKVDGWIKVDVDGTAMYIYLSSTRPQ